MARFKHHFLVVASFVFSFSASNQVFAQSAPSAGSGLLSNWTMSWPRYREFRDMPGQSYTDMTPTGRKGYFVPLPSPGLDDMGNGPSMAYSPIFNAPQPLLKPTPLNEAAPVAVPAPRSGGLFRRFRSAH